MKRSLAAAGVGVLVALTAATGVRAHDGTPLTLTVTKPGPGPASSGSDGAPKYGTWGVTIEDVQGHPNQVIVELRDGSKCVAVVGLPPSANHTFTLNPPSDRDSNSIPPNVTYTVNAYFFKTSNSCWGQPDQSGNPEPFWSVRLHINHPK